MSFFDLSNLIRLIVLYEFYQIVQCFWPPPYIIDLHDEDSFEISDDFDLKMDKIIGDGDEMIPDNELSRFNFNRNPHKFVRLHQVVDGIEKRSEYEKGFIENKLNISEENFYKEYSEEKKFLETNYSSKVSFKVNYMYKTKGQHPFEANCCQQVSAFQLVEVFSFNIFSRLRTINNNKR